jgi:hypothetical protein
LERRHVGGAGFFRGDAGALLNPGELVEAYFDVAHFWRDIAYVMDLGFADLREHHRQALRIMKARGESR